MTWYLLEVTEEFRRGKGRFWRPKSCGYTNDPSQAGVYGADDPTVKRALRQAEMADDPEYPMERRTRAVPIASVLAELDAEIATLAHIRSRYAALVECADDPAPDGGLAPLNRGTP